MPLNLYNTLTRQKEEFKPLHEGHVGIYVCGPTVYGHSHIGHAKSYVSFDTIVRYLRFTGYNVTYVQNITDVGHLLGDTNEGEDRLIRQSRLEQRHPMAIAETYTRSYFEDMDVLGVMRPDISPRATGHILEQIEMIEMLIGKGYAYEVNGSVYFDVSKDKDYGKLSGRNTEEAESGTRVESRSEKRHPNDFALWKRAEPEHIMRWNSPWGVGFPGWHVECSAMSTKYLGQPFDIHGGGMDNQFPHHECEIAQSECATDKQFVRYWIHNNLVTVNGQKMSKSLGNVFLLKDLFKKYDPHVIRFFILQSHYRSTLDFTYEALDGAVKGLEKLKNTLRNIRKKTGSPIDPGDVVPGPAGGMLLQTFKTSFQEAMDDDFNTPRAIGVLFDLSKEANVVLSNSETDVRALEEFEKLFLELGVNILGILSPYESKSSSTDGLVEDQLLKLLIDLRKEVRAQKLWQLSDKIRDGLADLGVALEDKKDGTTWRKV
ncbi:MAG TPA: cysteine--tRNA ligase [Bacteroidota bacterium]|jgi:cysteinyl-tRNA synthetase|nr:cysteine--tRNA ligase [Bacteroidota bacterium]